MEREIITSQQNKLVKHVKGLHTKKNRRMYNQCIVEGIRIIEECLKHHIPIAFVLYTEELRNVQGGSDLLEKLKRNNKLYEISKDLYRKLSDTENPQGIMAIVDIKNTSLQELSIKDEDFYIILNEIQDPGNMGTIIRTAEAAGVDAVILTKGCVDPYNTKTVRATMGALFHMPIIQLEGSQEWIYYLKKKGVKLIASNLNTDNTYLDIDYQGKIAIIIGNEANGIDQSLLSKVDMSIKIPILGKVESLNASVASAILIYKAIEKKRFMSL
ncbi:RNA methyltransferase, TrmH family [Natronincola peptidivorans]|uniref:RNA methyltransferase, TrmH family n=1 Tax=Natronincola peptidivorans TaxID=426128 RepID=A0A1I0EVW7_9FIRM|nr:RNA methyltransferase [Natronincola peptidivorans]SET49770.1 RNA methyltransferase, TrmH family [Natronincola peptidivorans]